VLPNILLKKALRLTMRMRYKTPTTLSQNDLT
jgi:hypothetical protein